MCGSFNLGRHSTSSVTAGTRGGRSPGPRSPRSRSRSRGQLHSGEARARPGAAAAGRRARPSPGPRARHSAPPAPGPAAGAAHDRRARGGAAGRAPAVPAPAGLRPGGGTGAGSAARGTRGWRRGPREAHMARGGEGRPRGAVPAIGRRLLLRGPPGAGRAARCPRPRPLPPRSRLGAVFPPAFPLLAGAPRWRRGAGHVSRGRSGDRGGVAWRGDVQATPRGCRGRGGAGGRWAPGAAALPAGSSGRSRRGSPASLVAGSLRPRCPRVLPGARCVLCSLSIWCSVRLGWTFRG